MIKLQTYKYKDLCAALGEKIKTGKSKQLQLKNWERQFRWEKPTSQLYKITEIYDTPTDKIDNRGGARVGAGAPLKMQEEFEYIFNCFLKRQWYRNQYNFQPNWHHAYFSNNEISIYFGLYRDSFYTYLNECSPNKEAFNKVSAKLIQKRRSLIFDKINRIDDIIITSGIVCTKRVGHPVYGKRVIEYRDDLLEEWLKYQKEYLDKNEFQKLYKVLESEKWLEMLEYISAKWPEYEKVEMQHKIIYGDEYSSRMFEYELGEYKNMRYRFNLQIVEDLKTYFANHETVENLDVIYYIIDTYVKLTNH